MNVSLKMNLLNACRSTAQAAARSSAAPVRTTSPMTSIRFASSFPRPNQMQRPVARAVAIPYPGQQAGRAYWSKLAAVGLGAGVSVLGVNAFTGSSTGGFPKVECESISVPSAPPARPQAGDANSGSIVSPYQLTLGGVCGVCAGVFVKKGARALAFLLGGVFVLMQYLQSRSFININWSKATSTFDNTFGTKTDGGLIKRPTVGGVYQWLVDFLTANFQQRATFLAGFALGIRLG